ncbi:TPA: DMT family transporter [Vibrio parahaemolyticus]
MNKLAPFLFLFIWSSGAVVVKFGLQYASVWSFLAARSLVSMCCLIMLFWLYSYRKPSLIRSPSKTELRRILVVAALLQVCYLSFYFLAIDTGISPGLVTLILGLQPLLTPFLCKQQVSRRQLALLLLGFLGLVISIYGAKDLTQLAAYGVVLGIAALFSITFGTVLQASIVSHVLLSAMCQSVLATPILMGINVLVGGSIIWTPEFLISLVWMSVGVSVGALLLLMHMTKQDGASSVSVLFYAIPLLAYFFDYALFGTQISLLTIVGMFVVALAIVFYRRFPAEKVQRLAR